MNIKLKLSGQDYVMKVETKANVEEIMIGEGIMDATETVSVCFKSGDTSGIIEFGIAEFEDLKNVIEQNVHLIKSTKKIKVSPDEVPF